MPGGRGRISAFQLFHQDLLDEMLTVIVELGATRQERAEEASFRTDQ
jgi:hypothetical protein